MLIRILFPLLAVVLVMQALIFPVPKVVEAAGIFSATQDLEEWAHVEGLAYPLDFPCLYRCLLKGKVLGVQKN